MAKAVERAHAIGADAVQVFADNPTAWRRREEPSPELDAFRERLDAYGIGPVAIHASYLVNLAGDDPDFGERSAVLLAEELRSAPGFQARFVNVHIGSHRDTTVDAGVDRLARAVARVLGDVGDGPDSAQLVLENAAGGGFVLGATVPEIADIAEAIAARGVPNRRLGFCIDTAHAWGAGADLATPDGVDAFVEELDARIGIERVVMVHLNDSKAERGSRLDRHEHIGAGRIGGAGLARVLTHPRLAHVTYYLETPGMDEGYDAINLARARDLAAGLPLATLPPEAMTLRGSRARTGPAEVTS